MAKNVCPYCGSNDIELRIRMEIDADLDNGGNVVITDTNDTLYKKLEYASHLDFICSCNDCHKDLGFDIDTGITEEMD